jgi:hypothetical protein
MFFLGLGRPEAEVAFAQALQRAYSTARFDTAALAHAGRALLARSRGDAEGFAAERSRARIMATISPNPESPSFVEQLLGPDEPEEDPEPPTF